MMKKLFGQKDKQNRPASASDSTLQVPRLAVYKTHSSNERISTSTSYSSSSTTSTRVTTVHIGSADYSNTFPRLSYKPVYKRTQELSQRFDRASPSRHSTKPSIGNNFLPSGPLHPSTPFSRPFPSPSAMPSTLAGPKNMQTDARLFQNADSKLWQPDNSSDLLNPLKVKVTKCLKPINNTEERVPTYKTNSKGKRGSLLVINNIKFEKHEKERKGAEKDVQNIRELFSQLNFDVTIKTNLRKLDMEQALKTYSKRNLGQYSINVVMMMSHGCGDAGGNSTQIIGTDGQSLPTSDVINYFTNANSPTLAGKPKIFIFQCCRGNQEHIYTDARQSIREGDMLLAYATIPGFVSYRQEYVGSWYIQAICKVFMTNAHDTHVEDMLKMVDEVLAEKAIQFNRAQTSSYENRGFKCCYLNPM